MSLSLGTLEIGLGLNTAQYDSGIKSAKDQLSSLEDHAQKITRDIEWSLKQSIPKLTIVPVVDHRPLHGLNKHLSEKEKHIDRVSKKVIRIKVDDSELQEIANKTVIVQASVQSKGSSQKYSNEIKQKVEVSIKNANLELLTEIKAVTKEIKEVVKSVSRLKPTAIGTISNSLIQGIGFNLTKSFSQGFEQSFTKKTGFNFESAGQKTGNITASSVQFVQPVLNKLVDTLQIKIDKITGRDKPIGERILTASETFQKIQTKIGVSNNNPYTQKSIDNSIASFQNMLSVLGSGEFSKFPEASQKAITSLTELLNLISSENDLGELTKDLADLLKITIAFSGKDFLQIIKQSHSLLKTQKALEGSSAEFIGALKQAVSEQKIIEQGFRLIARENHKSFFVNDEGKYIGTDNVGGRVIGFTATPKQSMPGVGQDIYEIAFSLDSQFSSLGDAAQLTKKEVIQLKNSVSEFFNKFVSNTNEAILTASPENADQKGKRRGSIYQRFGFVPEGEGNRLVAQISSRKIVEPNLKFNLKQNEQVTQISKQIEQRLTTTLGTFDNLFQHSISQAIQYAKSIIVGSELIQQDLEQLQKEAQNAEYDDSPAIQSQNKINQNLKNLQARIKQSKRLQNDPILRDFSKIDITNIDTLVPKEQLAKIALKITKITENVPKEIVKKLLERVAQFQPEEIIDPTLLGSIISSLTKDIQTQLTGVTPQLKMFGSGVNSNYLNLLPEKKRESFLKKQTEYEQALIKYEQTNNPEAKIPTPPQLSKIDKQTIAKNLRIEDVQREVSYVIQNANTLRKASQDAIDRVNNLLAKVPKNERFGHPLASLKGNLTQLKESAENVNPIYDLKKLGVNKEILDAIDVKSQVIPEMTDTGSSIVSGLVQGLNSKLAELETVSIDIASIPLEITKQINKIQSPSKEFEKVGKNIVEGEIKGIKSKEKDLQATMAIIAKNMIENRYLATKNPVNIDPFFPHQIEAYQKQSSNTFIGDIQLGQEKIQGVSYQSQSISQVNQKAINQRLALEAENEANRKATNKALTEASKYTAKIRELSEKDAERTRKHKAEKEAWAKLWTNHEAQKKASTQQLVPVIASTETLGNNKIKTEKTEEELPLYTPSSIVEKKVQVLKESGQSTNKIEKMLAESAKKSEELFLKEMTKRSAKKAEEIYAKTIKEFKQKALPPAINLGSIPDPWTEASTGGADGQPPKPPINRPVASSDPEPEPNKQVKSASKIIQNIDNPTQLQKIGKAFEAIKNQLNNLPEPIKRVLLGARTLLSAFAGFQILQQAGVFFRQFTTDSFQAALNMERLETVLNFSTGNAESSLAKLKIQADRLGISFLSSAKNYQQFSASVINTPLEFQKDKIFEGITLGLATRGASSQQQDRALLAITQIASKGRVSMEELNSQLGEAMPGALQIAARSMGLTSQEFIKLVESGSILAEDLLPKLATQINLESAGGLSVIDDTAFAQVARVQNQIELLRISLGESLLNASKLGLPLITKGLEILTKNGQSLATVLTSIGVVSAGGFIMVLKNIGLIDLGLKALGVTAASTRGAISQIGVGLLKGLGWTALIYGVMEAFKELYQYINAGSEESKRSLKSTQESLQELRRLLEKPLPTPKASTVITDSATAIQRFKNNRERDKSLEFTAGGLIDTTQILRLSTDTFSDTKIIEFTGKLDTLRQKAKDLKIDEIIASGDADVKKATSVRQEIAKVNQEIQALTEKYFPQIGLIVNEIASTEERITAIKKVLDDPGSSNSQKDNASIQLEIAEVQLRKLKESQEKYNEAVKENLVNYQRLTEQINKVARALSNIEFVSSGRTILSETDIKRQVLSGNLKPFEIDLTVREQSLSIVKDQFNSLNGLLATKEKELQNTLTDQINQRITELMPELNGIDFRTALQQGSVSPEAIGDRLQQLGDQAPFELNQVLETAKQQASIRRQTLTIDKSIVDTELEIANARRERARNARQASIVGANVNERIATLRQLPFGGPAASYRDALSEVRNQERLLGEAYRRLESASDDPNVIQQEVDNTRLALEQARANLLQQQTSLQDYYRNLDRQIIDFNRQIKDYRRQIEDAQLSAFRENRSLSESYTDLVRELDKNLLNAQNQLLDATDRIRVQQVKNRLLIPGTSDAGKELGDIFLEFVQGQADIASRGRTFQSRTEEIETSYISTLRNIRNLQEQQQEAERNRLKTIEDIKRTQEDLNRTLADLIRQTNKELGFIPQSIKDIVTNLNTLPEPIKLINSELVAIPPNIKTSGEDLVKSIEETAEAIRKAKEGLILPAPSNFAPAPVWNGGGFLPPPASFSTFPTSSTLPSTLTPRGQQASQYLNNPQIRAFLDLVAYAEGTDYMPNEGYNTLFGHGQFVSFRDHPRQRVSKNGLRSDAAGRYQIMQATWDEEKAKLGLQDFSPTSQDLVAISRIMMRGALDEVLKGDVVGALFAARQEWAAFPGAGYGQRERSKESLTRKYQEIVKKYEQPSSTPSASTSSTIFVRRSGQKTPEGLEILRFDLIKDGKIIDTVIGGVTGRPSTQSAIGTNKTNIRGSETPLPDGNWSIDANHASRYLRQFNSGQFRNYNPSQIPVGTVGPAWIGAEPKFSTGRSQIGFHLDDLKIGSAGCLVFTDPNQIAKIANWVVQSGANSMFVDLDGKQTSRGGQGGSRDSIPSPSPSVQQQITNRLPKNIQSVLVQEVGGETVYSKNAQTPPASPASTIKVIIADLIAKEIASGKLSLKDAIAIKSPLVDPHGQLKANQVRTVEQLIQLMLEKSDNTATNVLIDRLGGLTRATELAKKEGYKNTTISRYLNIPGSGTPNISTAQDVTLAMQSLIKDQNPASQLAEQSLRQTRNFKYNNEIGGKIGNNSKVIGNVGLVNINGKEYIVTAYANINGNQLNNRTIITNATNAISQSIKDSTPNPSPVPIPTSVPVLQPPRVLTKEETKEGKGGPEFSSPPPIAQLPTLPNQNQDNFWDADLPPVPKDNPINFQSPNLPPVPNLPTGNLDAAADQIRNAETANQNAEELLRQLEASFLIDTTLDRAIKFGRQQEEDARALERTLRDASENVADLTINSKGYLTVQEEINKSATEVSRQYRSQIESLEDQRRTLLLNADGWQKMSENIKKVVAEQIALGKMPADVAEQFLKNADALAKRVESAKEQVTILDQAIERLGKNQGVATLEASFRKTRDTVRSIRDRLNDLTIQRLKLENQSRPTLFDDSAILAERISLQKEKEELEDYLEPYKDLPQYADFVANIRSEWEKLAELRLERVALDASPNRGAAESFFSDIREGKGIGSAFSSLGLNIATKFVEGITKPAIDALTSAIDGFTKPITQAFESVFNAIIGPVGNFFTNALNSIFKPVGNIFSSIFGGGGGGGLFNGLLSGITGIFSGGLGGLGSIGSLGSIGASSFASAPASAFSLGTGFSLFSDGGKVGDANVPIEKNIISAFQRERAMSGGRKPRLIVANEDELILNPKETEAYLDYRNNAPIKNYANGGFVGGKPNYSTTSNNNSSNQSLIINNTNNVTVESRNDMGYSLNQLKERENTQNERTKKRFFG
jgi:tape measure domain-containing protein